MLEDGLEGSFHGAGEYWIRIEDCSPSIGARRKDFQNTQDISPSGRALQPVDRAGDLLEIHPSRYGWDATTTDRGTMLTRIKLHLICPCRNWQQARFHLTGIVREFVPKNLQERVR
jgi:hypothetical protein